MDTFVMVAVGVGIGLTAYGLGKLYDWMRGY